MKDKSTDKTTEKLNLISPVSQIKLKKLYGDRDKTPTFQHVDPSGTEMFREALTQNLSKIYPEYAVDTTLESDPVLKVVFQILAEYDNPIARKLIDYYYYELKPNTQVAVEFYYKRAIEGDQASKT